eukprot:5137096-Alexandrium_andersonii.AAC.1
MELSEILFGGALGAADSDERGVCQFCCIECPRALVYRGALADRNRACCPGRKPRRCDACA